MTEESQAGDCQGPNGKPICCFGCDHRPASSTEPRDALAGALDVAWAEAEAALPEGWRIHMLSVTASDEWQAVAGVREDRGQDPFIALEVGPTPAAALRALTERLREVRG